MLPEEKQRCHRQSDKKMADWNGRLNDRLGFVKKSILKRLATLCAASLDYFNIVWSYFCASSIGMAVALSLRSRTRFWRVFNAV